MPDPLLGAAVGLSAAGTILGVVGAIEAGKVNAADRANYQFAFGATTAAATVSHAVAMRSSSANNFLSVSLSTSITFGSGHLQTRRDVSAARLPTRADRT